MDTISRSKFVEGRWVSLRMVMMTRMLFGFYCNISCNKILLYLARLYCICLKSVATTMLFIGCFKYEIDVLFFLPLCFEYNINGLVSIFTGDNHIINFYKEIERVDREMGLEHQPFMTIRCEALFLFFCGYKNILLVLLSFAMGQQHLFFFACVVMSYSVIIGNVSRCFPLELLRLRVKHLWYGLELDLKRENWRENINQINSVTQNFKLYRHFMDELMLISWEKLLNFENTYLIKVASADSVVTIALTCLPPLLCEMVAKEVDKLKIVIGNALLVCDDADLQVELRGAAKYLALRPFSATVCRAFALNAPLVLTFLSLCTTYTIVVMQYLDFL